MKSIKYNKLIRDKIPEIIRTSGKTPIVAQFDARSYKEGLDDKLSEELKEYLASDDIEELADLVEVIYAIIKYKNVGMEEFERIRTKKALERGAFDKRLKLVEVIEE